MHLNYMTEETALSKVLREIETIASVGYREIGSYLPGDRMSIGFFCSYVPEELIYAAGGHPFRLMGTPIKISHVQVHLPPYCCHLVKSSLESLLQGELHFLKGMVFTHSCDSMLGLSDIWALQKPFPIHFNLMIPSHFDSQQSRVYLKAEIERFKDFLDSHIGKITPQNLKASIQLFNRIRESLKEMYQRRRGDASQLPGKVFAQIIRAGYLMNRLRYLELMKELLGGLEEESHGNKDRVPIYVTGNMTHSDTWFSLIEETGAFIVQDDLCSGARTFRLAVREDLDPIEALTDRYFNSYFCPTKYAGAQAHLETLLKDVQDSGAKGVIFLLYKYCEAHFFDYPDLKLVLESKGIPTLLLEVEDPSYSIGQLKIRIQAFIEMLSPIWNSECGTRS
jgi:benzoyl-CoA reductase/2-hydroxyglutaryl-CoA dehydratase subunit BcrC/BadD/HgdB